MDSKLITSWVTIWGINDLSFSGYQLINRLSLYGPSPQTACHFPILDESIFQGARCSSAVAENLRPNVPGSEFQASGGGKVPVLEGRLEKTHLGGPKIVD